MALKFMLLVSTSLVVKVELIKSLLSSGFEPTGCVPRHLAKHDKGAPKIYQWMGTYLQTIGSNAHLICRAEGGHKTVWVDPAGEVIQGDHNDKYSVGGLKKKKTCIISLWCQKVLKNGDLVIRKLTFDDMGMFKCIVTNHHGEDMAETFVYPAAEVRPA